MTYWSSQVTDGQVALASLTGVTCYLIHLGKFITLKILISTLNYEDRQPLSPSPSPPSTCAFLSGLGIDSTKQSGGDLEDPTVSGT